MVTRVYITNFWTCPCQLRVWLGLPTGLDWVGASWLRLLVGVGPWVFKFACMGKFLRSYRFVHVVVLVLLTAKKIGGYDTHLQIRVAHARTASEFKCATPFQPIRLLNLSSNPIRDGGVPYLKYLVGDNALNLNMWTKENVHRFKC